MSFVCTIYLLILHLHGDKKIGLSIIEEALGSEIWLDNPLYFSKYLMLCLKSTLKILHSHAEKSLKKQTHV